ncbi:MAG TPA: hypothetical protein VH044_19060 [Polyangiaceae bacterium]|nr:hypothetical protein [Polyangiaceae bacterium]
MSRVLFSDAHVTVTLDEARGFARYTRSRAPYATLDELRTSHAAMVAALPVPVPAGIRLLVDLREAPPRNDEAFEAEMRPLLAQFMQGFAARAVLVKSAVGRLQVQRLARPYEARPQVFDDEGKALQHLGLTP